MNKAILIFLMAIITTWQGFAQYPVFSEIPVIAFSSNGTKNADAFVVVNTNKEKNKPVVVKITGTKNSKFIAFRTTEDEKEKYAEIGVFKVENGELFYEAPKGSVTTFFAL